MVVFDHFRKAGKEVNLRKYQEESHHRGEEMASVVASDEEPLTTQPNGT